MVWLNHHAGKHNWVPFWHTKITGENPIIDPRNRFTRNEYPGR
jgi:hypothetical protein